MRIISLLIVFAYLFVFCDTDSKAEASKSTISKALSNNESALIAPVQTIENNYNRTACMKRVQQKLTESKPIVVHVKIPLCDNDNQGIVRVSKALGDGNNLHTNLYWGALYGMKTHFKKSKVWELIWEEKNIDDNILERVVFFSKYPSGAQVYVVADAYRGDKMKNCLEDYLQAISGHAKQSIEIDELSLGINSNADLNAFNGHNGLMDETVENVRNQDGIIREAVAIACISGDYFDDYLIQAHAYPTLMTTNLLAPEAYVLEAVIDAWVDGKTDSEIRSAAGVAYDKYQKCGLRGATNLFKSGW